MFEAGAGRLKGIKSIGASKQRIKKKLHTDMNPVKVVRCRAVQKRRRREQ